MLLEGTEKCQKKHSARCKKPIDKEKEDFVVITKGTAIVPELLTHVSCEQNRPRTGGRIKPHW